VDKVVFPCDYILASDGDTRIVSLELGDLQAGLVLGRPNYSGTAKTPLKDGECYKLVQWSFVW
jgi:hypothetical protein